MRCGAPLLRHTRTLSAVFSALQKYRGLKLFYLREAAARLSRLARGPRSMQSNKRFEPILILWAAMGVVFAVAVLTVVRHFSG